VIVDNTTARVRGTSPVMIEPTAAGVRAPTERRAE
jgi:hypothetical protein